MTGGNVGVRGFDSRNGSELLVTDEQQFLKAFECLLQDVLLINYIPKSVNGS
jgi:hypothetical protein